MTRSHNMSRIRSRDTGPEVKLRKALWGRGLRYRVDDRRFVGRPDIVIPSAGICLFVDGCFWHGCPDHYVRPRSRCEYWAGKLARNVERDQEVTSALEDLGWRVVRIWEHEVAQELDSVVDEVMRLASDPSQLRRSTAWRVVQVVEESEDGTERRVLTDLYDPRERLETSGPRVTRSRSG